MVRRFGREWSAEQLMAFLRTCVDMQEDVQRLGYAKRELAYYLSTPATRAIALAVVPRNLVVEMMLDGYINFNTGE